MNECKIRLEPILKLCFSVNSFWLVPLIGELMISLIFGFDGGRTEADSSVFFFQSLQTCFKRFKRMATSIVVKSHAGSLVRGGFDRVALNPSEISAKSLIN